MGAINLEYIKQRRKQLKVSQNDIANVLGLGSAAAYSHYELGRSDFKAEHLPKICEMLKCDIDELYNDGELLNQKSVDELLEAIRKRWRA